MADNPHNLESGGRTISSDGTPCCLHCRSWQRDKDNAAYGWCGHEGNRGPASQTFPGGLEPSTLHTGGCDLYEPDSRPRRHSARFEALVARLRPLEHGALAGGRMPAHWTPDERMAFARGHGEMVADDVWREWQQEGLGFHGGGEASLVDVAVARARVGLATELPGTTLTEKDQAGAAARERLLDLRRAAQGA